MWPTLCANLCPARLPRTSLCVYRALRKRLTFRSRADVLEEKSLFKVILFYPLRKEVKKNQLAAPSPENSRRFYFFIADICISAQFASRSGRYTDGDASHLIAAVKRAVVCECLLCAASSNLECTPIARKIAPALAKSNVYARYNSDAPAECIAGNHLQPGPLSGSCV